MKERKKEGITDDTVRNPKVPTRKRNLFFKFFADHTASFFAKCNSIKQNIPPVII